MSDARKMSRRRAERQPQSSDLPIDGPPRIVVSCEHAGNDVPEAYQHLFRSPGAARSLASHRGWDLAALPLARYVAEQWGAPLHHSTLSRLLIDLNRSLDSHELHSKHSLRLAEDDRRALVDRYYTPYRQRVEQEVRSIVTEGGTALHVSVHSFAPRIRGVWRSLEIGLLFDPDRPSELLLCERWQQLLMRRLPRMRIRLNEPYLGISDGLTTTLRRRLPSSKYLGIEIEVNQRLRRLEEPAQQRLYAALADSLLEALQ